MPRRERSQDLPFDAALKKVGRLVDSPLKQVAEKLRDFLIEAKHSLDAHQLDSEEAANLAAYVIHVADRLPRSFDQRFHFDSALIRAIGEDWGEDLLLSRMIMPRHESDWGHERLIMPSENLNRAHVVDLIHMPGDDRLGQVDLLTYPWIIHEMGHYLLLQYDSHFVPAFKLELEKTKSSLRLGAISDRGLARATAQNTVDEVVSLWTPSLDQKNWAHELTIDLISLWTCGPAYLACFHDVVQNPEINPYEVTPTHPPYATRAEALINGAARRGLQEFTADLKRLLKEWSGSRWKRRKDNRFVALARPELIEACTKIAFSLCDSLKLRACSREKLRQIPQMLSAYNADELGLDLLLLAWFVFEDRGKEAYSTWEAEIVGQLKTRIMQ